VLLYGRGEFIEVLAVDASFRIELGKPDAFDWNMLEFTIEL
jgi:hypothetical protein